MKIISKKNNPGLDSIVDISNTTSTVNRVLELRVLEATKEASIAISSLLDDVSLDFLKQDLEHLQKQITIIENNIVRIQEKR